MTAHPENTAFTLHRDAWGRLVLTWPDGRRVEGVVPIRAFPISAPDGFLSICDSAGRELLFFESLESLPSDARRLIEEELARREFLPVVLRIIKVRADTDPSHWQIITDRGPTEFLMEDSDNDVRRLGTYGILLTDSHGIRYLIPDWRRLDAAGRRILDRYL